MGLAHRMGLSPLANPDGVGLALRAGLGPLLNPPPAPGLEPLTKPWEWAVEAGAAADILLGDMGCCWAVVGVGVGEGAMREAMRLEVEARRRI